MGRVEQVVLLLHLLWPGGGDKVQVLWGHLPGYQHMQGQTTTDATGSLTFLIFRDHGSPLASACQPSVPTPPAFSQVLRLTPHHHPAQHQSMEPHPVTVDALTYSTQAVRMARRTPAGTSTLCQVALSVTKIKNQTHFCRNLSWPSHQLDSEGA